MPMPMLSQKTNPTIKLLDSHGAEYSSVQKTQDFLDLFAGDDDFQLEDRSKSGPNGEKALFRMTCSAERLISKAGEIHAIANHDSDMGLKWTGGDIAGYLTRRFEPDADAVRESEEILDGVEDLVADDIAAHRMHMVAAPIGGSPNVGAYLAQSPNSMHRVVSDYDSADATRIIVHVGSSWAIDADVIRRRGIAALAIARTLQAVRPVELIAAFVTQPLHVRMDRRVNTAFLVRIGTAPFDISTASRTLCDVYTKRGIMHRMAWVRAGNIGEERMDGLPFKDNDRDAIGVGEHDLFLPPLRNQREFQSNKTAIEWAAQEVKNLLAGSTMQGDTVYGDPWKV